MRKLFPKSDSKKVKKPARNVRKGSQAKTKPPKKRRFNLDFDVKFNSLQERLNDEKLKSTAGIISIFISIFLFLSIFSSFFKGTSDSILLYSEHIDDIVQIQIIENGTTNTFKDNPKLKFIAVEKANNESEESQETYTEIELDGVFKSSDGIIVEFNNGEIESDNYSTHKDNLVRNVFGEFGAITSHHLARGMFGLGALFFPFIVFLFGARLLSGKWIIRFRPAFFWGLTAMILAPLTIYILIGGIASDFITGNTTIFIADSISSKVKSIGLVSLVLLAYLIIACIVFPGWHKHIEIGKWLQKLKSNLPKWLNKKADLVDIDNGTSGEGVIPATSPEIEVEVEPESEPEVEIQPEPLAEEVPEKEEDLDQIINDFLDPPKEKSLSLNVVEKEEEETLTSDEHRNLVQEFGEFDPTLELSKFKMPGLDHLVNHGDGANKVSDEELESNKDRIIETLQNFKIEVSKITAEVGPTVTLYEIVPAPGIRISKIKRLEDDIALSLSALGIRIIAPIPGKGTIGIEVPNSKPDVVSMLALISSDKFQNSEFELPIAMGKTISNKTHVFDLAKMPHLLMAGATGQGKSVGLNAMLVSMLYRKHPSALKFVLVDPKKVELSVYNHISRHYLAQLPDAEDAIITDTDKVVNTLNSLCKEMDQRYDLLKDAQCRNIKEYNAKFIKRQIVPGSSKELHKERGHHYLPYIVLVVDEFADLIMTAGKEVETPIARLAQLARAIGIHLIIATQRPSVNIITGTIKANFPARVAFRVTSKVDSRTILDAGGADQLIGRGDMLMSTGSEIIRLQCGFVDTPEVESICDYIGAQRGYDEVYELPEYIPENSAASERGATSVEERDVLFEDAARIIVMHQQGSTSLLQRKLKLGYNRAGRLVDQLEDAGIIGPFEGSKARKVLIPDEMSLEQLLSRIKSEGNDTPDI